MNLQTTRKRSSTKGFTLIELLIVLAILAILATIGLASLSRSQRAGRDATRKTDLSNISGALEQYYADFDEYPVGDISVLESELEGGNSKGITYLREVKTADPQSVAYVYEGNSQSYCIATNLETNSQPRPGNCNGTAYEFVSTQLD
jgi:prepilin-type N-terminal cleavage/methylation domain-containing protein